MISLYKRRNQLMLNIALGCFGIFVYEASMVPPVFVSTILFLLTFSIFIKGGFHGRVYSCMAAVLCVLPLLHTIGFIFSDDYVFYPAFAKTLSDQLNPELRDRLALMGLVTMSGLIAGATAGHGTAPTPVPAVNHNFDVSIPKIALLAVASLIFIHLDAPSQTIFLAAYTESRSVASVQGMGSLFPISFGSNLMAWYCYFQLRPSLAKTYIFYSLVAVTLIIVVFYQLLRGNREFTGLMIGLLFLFDRYTKLHKHFLPLLFASIVFYFVLQFIGSYRSEAVSGVGIIEGLGTFVRDGDIFHGTWTATLLTPLATLSDFYWGQRDYLLGKTYVDYFLSIPPTPVANYFGYERPITSFQGPAWDVSYGVGGTYIAVVPFLNFSMIGVFVQTFVVGVLLGAIDRQSYGNSPMWVLLGFAVGVALWGIVWYGEMYLLRAIVTTFPLLAVTWFVLGISNNRNGPKGI